MRKRRHLRPSVSGVVLVVVGALTLAFPQPAAASQDPLAEAQARITAAQNAADEAATKFDTAQTRLGELERDANRTRKTIAALRDERRRLTWIVRERAVLLYKSSPTPFAELLDINNGDVLEAARRAELFDHANAESNLAIKRLGATTEDLHRSEATLEKAVGQQRKTIADLERQQTALQDALASATRAQAELRAQLERERRAAEYAALLRQAQAATRARAAQQAQAAQPPQPPAPDAAPPASDSGGDPGQIIGSGDWVCPVQGAVSFTDSWGAPRSGGRTHKGTDMFAAQGTPVVAVVAGSVFFQGDPLGGLAAYVTGADGTTYYYAHLNDYVGGARNVAAGELIAHNGSSGNADGGSPHVHFEIRLGGPNGTKINPYPTVRAHC